MVTLTDLILAIPSQAWIAIVTAVFTSGLTILGVSLTNNANTKRLRLQLEHEKEIKNEEMLRDRLEELYVTSNKYLDALIGYYLPYRMVMKGQLTFNQALDITIESKKDYDPHRVTMLINMYFPEVKPAFDEILGLREKLNRIVDSYKEQYRTGVIDGSKYLEVFQPLLEKLDELAAGFHQHVVRIKY